jgi:hypothetical protein
MTPSLVHSRNWTWATSSGRTQVTPRASAPVGGLAKGGVALDSGRSCEASFFRVSVLKPVPTFPANRRARPS